MRDRRRLIAPALAVLGCVGLLSLGHGERSSASESLPSRLTDREFWRLSVEMSEPAGSFRSENLVSNEHTFQYVLPALARAVRPGGVYLGVAPDQNFTYIVATRPQMAFIVDIRRGNLLQHLMYKAIIELSADRAEFVSRLFSKPMAESLSPEATVTEVFTALARGRRSDELYRRNLRAITDHLTAARGFPLSDTDLQQLEAIYFAFFRDGPNIRYSTGARGFGRGNAGFPSYEELMLQTDWDGQSRSYLASEAAFGFLKQFQERNLIVPVMGDFAGPKALRSVGQYIRSHGATVSAFYVSNVEQYLFQGGTWDAFARNVATLPVDSRSTFIRSVSTRYGYAGGQTWLDGRANAMDPMAALVADFEAGRVRSYADVNMRSR